MAEIKQPTREQIKSARIRASHTQAQAAATVHAGSYRSWQDWEAGRRPIALAAWELYLIKTGAIQVTDD